MQESWEWPLGDTNPLNCKRHEKSPRQLLQTRDVPAKRPQDTPCALEKNLGPDSSMAQQDPTGQDRTDPKDTAVLRGFKFIYKCCV